MPGPTSSSGALQIFISLHSLVKNLNDEINISTEFVYCIEMSNHVMKLFSSSGSATTLVFEYFHNIRCGKTVFLH